MTQRRKNNKDGEYVVYERNVRSKLARINKFGKIRGEITQIGQFEECRKVFFVENMKNSKITKKKAKNRIRNFSGKRFLQKSIFNLISQHSRLKLTQSALSNINYAPTVDPNCIISFTTKRTIRIPSLNLAYI